MAEYLVSAGESKKITPIIPMITNFSILFPFSVLSELLSDD
jgi:hypothetical protein